MFNNLPKEIFKAYDIRGIVIAPAGGAERTAERATGAGSARVSDPAVPPTEGLHSLRESLMERYRISEDVGSTS